MKRMSCAGLAVFLVLVVLCGVVWANGYVFPGGDGSSGNPWHITNWHDLNGMRDYLGAASSGRHFKLMNNLGETIGGYAVYNSGPFGWVPIGTALDRFTGAFDGNNNTITGLFIDRGGEAWIGLFGYVGAAGTVKNINLENVNITGNSRVGGLVGRNDGTIQNSYSTGEVSGDYDVGGLAGYNNGVIQSSYSRGEVSGGSSVGGLVGYNDGTIQNSYSRGTVSGSFSHVGGLAGYNDGVIENAYSTGNVAGNILPGGLVGVNDGGISDSFYDEEISGKSDTGKGEPKTTAEMKTKSTFTDAGWDFDNIWDINALNDGYPFLRQRVPSPSRRRRPSAAPEPEPDPEYPLPPEGFNALPGAGFLPSMKLTWLPSASPNIEKYQLYASTGVGASSAGVSTKEAEGLRFWLLAEFPAGVIEYTHTGLTRNVRYYYVVTSVNEEGIESNVSSRILCCVAGTGEISELDAVSWGPERLIEAPEAEDGGSGCFIATAAYGSAMSSEVMSLRKFRDGFLLSSGAGRRLVESYYAASPVFAGAIDGSGILRKVARLQIAPFARFAGYLTSMN